MQKIKVDWTLIWKEFRRGDMEAFRSIYSAFVGKLYAYGHKLTPDIQIVEDSIQELFLDMYTHRQNLSETNNLEYYLLKAIRQVIFHRLKNENRFYSMDDFNSKAFNVDFEIEKNNHDDIRQEKIERIKKSLNSLTPKNREILYLKFYRRFSYQQIGEMLEMQPDSAKKQVYRVIAKLKEDLSSQLLQLLYLCFRA